MTDLHLGVSRQNSVRMAAAILTFLLAAACGVQPSLTNSPSASDFGQPSSAAASSPLHEATSSPAVPTTTPAISTTAASTEPAAQTTVSSSAGKTTRGTLSAGSSLAHAEQLDKLKFVDGAYSCGAQTGPSDSEPEALVIFFYSKRGPVVLTYGNVGCSFITNGPVTVYSNREIVKEIFSATLHS